MTKVPVGIVGHIHVNFPLWMWYWYIIICGEQENNLAVDPMIRYAALYPFGGVWKQLLRKPLAICNMKWRTTLTVQECSVCITSRLIAFLNGIKKLPYQLLSVCTTCRND